MGGGVYDGQGAMAFGIGVTTFDGHWRLNGALGYAPGVNMVGGAAGVSYSF